MPLSEDEQRILRQIEQDLRSDPTFAPSEDSTSVGRLVWLMVAVIVGIGVTVAALSVHPILSFMVFLGVLGVGLAAEREARVIGRERLGDLPINAWLSTGITRRHHDDD